MLSMHSDRPVLEASLGGRIDAQELRVMGEELNELFHNSDHAPRFVLIDYSKAKTMDKDALSELALIKTELLVNGIDKIVNIARDESEVVAHTTTRMQFVLEGKEEFLLEPEQAFFPGAVQRTTVFHLAELKAA